MTQFQNVLFNLKESLKTDIPPNSAVIEFNVEKGDAETMAMKLQPENNPIIK